MVSLLRDGEVLARLDVTDAALVGVLYSYCRTAGLSPLTAVRVTDTAYSALLAGIGYHGGDARLVPSGSPEASAPNTNAKTGDPDG